MKLLQEGMKKKFGAQGRAWKLCIFFKPIYSRREYRSSGASSATAADGWAERIDRGSSLRKSAGKFSGIAFRNTNNAVAGFAPQGA